MLLLLLVVDNQLSPWLSHNVMYIVSGHFLADCHCNERNCIFI